MHHVLDNCAVQLGVAVRIWDLCTDQTINVSHCAGLVLLVKHQQQVEMRQAPLLELNHTDVSFDLAQYATVKQQMQQVLDLLNEDPGNEVRAVSRILARQQTAHNLWPVSVAGSCDEIVWLANTCNPGHGILQCNASNVSTNTSDRKPHSYSNMYGKSSSDGNKAIRSE